MALVLPRRLAQVLPTTYSPCLLHMAKALLKARHLGFPYHTFVHCKGFAPAAPRGARTIISVSFSGLPLSGPLRIFGLVGRYPANSLIRRRLILEHYFSRKALSSLNSISGITLSFPRLFQTQGQIIDVLLSFSPVPEGARTCMAKSNPHSSNLPQDQRKLLSQEII